MFTLLSVCTKYRKNPCQRRYADDNTGRKKAQEAGKKPQHGEKSENRLHSKIFYDILSKLFIRQSVMLHHR